MDAGKGYLYQVLEEKRQFIVPVYQRLYSWTEKQCSRLWEDIINVHKKNKPGHFVGSIVDVVDVVNPIGINKYLLIDGQQRLTTLIILLVAIRDYAKTTGDSTINPLVIDMLIKNDERIFTGPDKYKLLLTENDKDTLIALIDSIPMSSISERIKAAYDYFLVQIKNSDITLGEIYGAINKLQIVNIILDKNIGDDPQAIFESLNSTGKELSESDLIRNYVLMGKESRDQDRLYTTIWRPMERLFVGEESEETIDRFFRDYLTMKRTSICKISEIYDEFKKFHRNECPALTIEDICNDLYTNALNYTRLVYLNHPDDDINNVYKDINSLKMEVSYPFIMNVANDFNNGEITKEEYVEILKLCVSYVLRRNICSIPTNSLNKTFSTLKNNIDKANYTNSIKAYLCLLDDYKRFPKNEEFMDCFESIKMYSNNNKSYILEKLENHNNKTHIVVSGMTIEHIMPQNDNLSPEWIRMLGSDYKSVHEKYLHTIGNLTLTNYNSELSDNDFMVKMELPGGFKKSALRLNEYVVVQTEWNEKTIIERAHILSDKATDIWEYPQVDAVELAKYQRKAASSQKEYSLDSYDNLNAFNKILLTSFDKNMLLLNPKIKREYKKNYVAYKLDNSNLACAVIQSSSLSIYISADLSQIDDPDSLLNDVTGKGHHGTGDLQATIAPAPDVDVVIKLIAQIVK